MLTILKKFTAPHMHPFSFYQTRSLEFAICLQLCAIVCDEVAGTKSTTKQGVYNCSPAAIAVSSSHAQCPSASTFPNRSPAPLIRFAISPHIICVFGTSSWLRALFDIQYCPINESKTEPCAFMTSLVYRGFYDTVLARLRILRPHFHSAFPELVYELIFVIT